MSISYWMCQGVGIRTNALIDDDIYDLGWLTI